MLKTDPNQKKARKRSSVDSTNDGDSRHFPNQKHSSKPSLNTEDSTSRRNQTNALKKQNYEEENKIFNDKNGYATASAKSSNKNNINEEEYKNRDIRSNTNNILKDSKSSTNANANNTNTTFNNNNTTNTSNNNLINVNTNINNKTYANDVKLSAAGNANNNNPLNNSNEVAKNTTNVNFKYDPTTNEIKDVTVKVDMDAETAYKLYQDNKKYLPTTQQVISGAKTSANFVQNSGVLNEIGNANNSGATAQPKKKAGADPLSSFFGSAFSKGPSGSDKGAGASSSSNTNSKKGMF